MRRKEKAEAWIGSSGGLAAALEIPGGGIGRGAEPPSEENALAGGEVVTVES